MQYQGIQKDLNQKWAGRILSTRSMEDEFRNDFWAFAFSEGRSYCRNESQCQELVEMMMNEFVREYSRKPLPQDIYSEMIVKLGLLYGKTGGKSNSSARGQGTYQGSTGNSYVRTGYTGYPPVGNTYSARADMPYSSSYNGGFEAGRTSDRFQGAPSYRDPAGYRPNNYVPRTQQPYTGADAWKTPYQGRSGESSYSAFRPVPAGTGYGSGMSGAYSNNYSYGNQTPSAGGYARSSYAEPAGRPREESVRERPVTPERETPPMTQNVPGGWNAGNEFNPQSPLTATASGLGAAIDGRQPPVQTSETTSQPPVSQTPGNMGQSASPVSGDSLQGAPQVSGMPVQPTSQNSAAQPGIPAVQTAGGQQVQMPGVQTGQPAVYTAPLQTAMPVGTIPMSTTVSVQPVMQIPVQPVMQSPVQQSIPNLAGVQDILGMKGGADSPEAQNMILQAARLIQAYNAVTKSNVGELEEEEAVEDNEIVEADPAKAANWRPPKFGFSRKEKKTEKKSSPAEPKAKKQKEEPVRKKVEVPDARPGNSTATKQEKEDDGKSPTFSVINTILLVLTGASVLFLIWETGLIQKFL